MGRYKINLANAPLTQTVLNAKRHRLETRWRECLLLAVVIGAAFGVAFWLGISNPDMDTSSLAGVMAVVLALLLVCTLHVLQLNYLTRTGLLPATESQLELVALARELPFVAGYLQAVQAQGRGLNRAEAGAIAKYSASVPRARISHARERGSSRDL